MQKLIFFAAVSAALVFFILPAPAQGGIFDFSSDCGSNASHHFTFGSRESLDRLQYTTRAYASSKFMRQVELDIDFPNESSIHSVKSITYIEALDQKTDGNGACLYIHSGGIGQKSVKLHFKSMRGNDIDHIVHIYGT